MVKRSPNYALVLGILILTNIAAFWVRERPVDVLFSPKFQSFPKTMGKWTGRDLEIDGEVRKVLNADSVLSRGYTESEYGNYAGLLIVYRKYGRRDFIHRPEACYPAAGWRIVDTGTTNLRFRGKDIEAIKVIAEKDGLREIVVYWFASGERTVANYMKQQSMMALDRFQPQKYGWAFVRINCPVYDTDEATMDTLRSFLETADKPIADVLTLQ